MHRKAVILESCIPISWADCTVYSLLWKLFPAPSLDLKLTGKPVAQTIAVPTSTSCTYWPNTLSKTPRNLLQCFNHSKCHISEMSIVLLLAFFLLQPPWITLLYVLFIVLSMQRNSFIYSMNWKYQELGS